VLDPKSLEEFLDRRGRQIRSATQFGRHGFIGKAGVAGFIDLVAESFRTTSPLVRFLTEAVGQPF